MELDNKTKTPQLVRASDETPRGNSCTQGSRRSKNDLKKKRERLPLTWWKTILRDTNLNLEQIEEMCQDRRIWRKFVKNVMPINIG